MVKISASDAKSALRKDIREKRAKFVSQLSHVEHQHSFQTIANALNPVLSSAKIAGLYAPYGDEAPALRYMKPLQSLGILTAMPAIIPQDIVFREFCSQNDFVKGPLGILEPPADKPVVIPDVIFMPLLAFDHQGHRLGQGGGYYDRYLSAHSSCRKIGFAWSVQRVDKVPVEPHDQKLDAVVTEQYVTIF